METQATSTQKKTMTRPTMATRDSNTMEMLFHRVGFDRFSFFISLFAADSAII